MPLPGAGAFFLVQVYPCASPLNRTYSPAVFLQSSPGGFPVHPPLPVSYQPVSGCSGFRGMIFPENSRTGKGGMVMHAAVTSAGIE